MKGSERLSQRIAVLYRTLAASFAPITGEVFQRYGRINGEQCAASFAYYAFFSLFPLILLLDWNWGGVWRRRFIVRQTQGMPVRDGEQGKFPRQRTKEEAYATLHYFLGGATSTRIFTA
jgi:hypothetical protein